MACLVLEHIEPHRTSIHECASTYLYIPYIYMHSVCVHIYIYIYIYTDACIYMHTWRTRVCGPGAGRRRGASTGAGTELQPPGAGTGRGRPDLRRGIAQPGPLFRLARNTGSIALCIIRFTWLFILLYGLTLV